MSDTVLIRAGFKATCVPAGSAEVSITGEMYVEEALDSISMLEITIKQIRRQIDKKTEAAHD
jgi:hypothetical protein